MSLPVEDIRHSFFNSLDHFPSDLVRTLWLCQSINVQLNECNDEDDVTRIDTLKAQQRKQSRLLSNLIKRQRKVLLREQRELSKQLHTRKRYSMFLQKGSGASSSTTTTTTTTTTNNSSSSEPRYCICNDVAYGDMIACDNPNCHKEWFHYKCINITKPPKGKWYCQDCIKKRKKH